MVKKYLAAFSILIFSMVLPASASKADNKETQQVTIRIEQLHNVMINADAKNLKKSLQPNSITDIQAAP